jgi:hypothetical protein
LSRQNVTSQLYPIKKSTTSSNEKAPRGAAISHIGNKLSKKSPKASDRDHSAGERRKTSGKQSLLDHVAIDVLFIFSGKLFQLIKLAHRKQTDATPFGPDRHYKRKPPMNCPTSAYAFLSFLSFALFFCFHSAPFFGGDISCALFFSAKTMAEHEGVT